MVSFKLDTYTFGRFQPLAAYFSSLTVGELMNCTKLTFVDYLLPQHKFLGSVFYDNVFLPLCQLHNNYENAYNLKVDAEKNLKEAERGITALIQDNYFVEKPTLKVIGNVGDA